MTTVELEFEEAVGFDCNDLLQDSVMVEIKVTDECGNMNIAMNEVKIFDKQGFCECNMTTSIKIGETSGLVDNDGIICAGDQAVLTACASSDSGSTGDGGGSTGEGAGGGDLAAPPTGTAEFSFIWSPSGSTDNTIIVTTGGVYTVTITDAIGCAVVETVTVQVVPTPTTMIDVSGTAADGTICKGETAILRANGGGTYSWNFGQESDAIAVVNSGTYIVTVTNENGHFNGKWRSKLFLEYWRINCWN